NSRNSPVCILRVYMPGDVVPTAATWSPTPIACSALTACGLTLTAAPISPRAGALSKTSAFIPNVFSACAAASPARPPPTIANLRLDDIRPPETRRDRPRERPFEHSMTATGLLLPPRSVHHRRGQPDVEGEHFMMDFFRVK